MQKTAQGFTLIEILIAIALVAIMGAVVIPGFLNYLKRGQIKATQATMRSIKTAINQFYADISQFPSTLKDLAKKPADEAVADKWTTPYLDKEPADAWGNKFMYKPAPENSEHEYELFSYGPKGKSAPKGEWLDVWKL